MQGVCARLCDEGDRRPSGMLGGQAAGFDFELCKALGNGNGMLCPVYAYACLAPSRRYSVVKPNPPATLRIGNPPKLAPVWTAAPVSTISALTLRPYGSSVFVRCRSLD